MYLKDKLNSFRGRYFYLILSVFFIALQVGIGFVVETPIADVGDAIKRIESIHSEIALHSNIKVKTWSETYVSVFKEKSYKFEKFLRFYNEKIYAFWINIVLIIFMLFNSKFFLENPFQRDLVLVGVPFLLFILTLFLPLGSFINIPKNLYILHQWITPFIVFNLLLLYSNKKFSFPRAKKKYKDLVIVNLKLCAVLILFVFSPALITGSIIMNDLSKYVLEVEKIRSR